MGEYDLKAANSALEALSLKDTDGDGVRNFASGRNIEFSLIAPNDNAFFPGQLIAPVIQADLKSVGLKANLQILSTSATFAKANAGDFEAAIYGFRQSTRCAAQESHLAALQRVVPLTLLAAPEAGASDQQSQYEKLGEAHF